MVRIASFGIVALISGLALAQNAYLSGVNCKAFQRQSDGGYVVTKDTQFVFGSGTMFYYSAGTLITKEAIVVGDTPIANLIEDFCNKR